LSKRIGRWLAYLQHSLANIDGAYHFIIYVSLSTVCIVEIEYDACMQIIIKWCHHPTYKPSIHINYDMILKTGSNFTILRKYFKYTFFKLSMFYKIYTLGRKYMNSWNKNLYTLNKLYELMEQKPYMWNNLYKLRTK